MLANAHNVTCSQALEVLGQIDCKAEASSAPAFSANQATAVLHPIAGTFMSRKALSNL